MSATGCYRCWTQGNRFTPAVWTDPEKDKLCESCRIALNWDESDCTAIGAPAPAREVVAPPLNHGWRQRNDRKKKAMGLDGSPQPDKNESSQGEAAATKPPEEKKKMGAKLTDRKCGHEGCTKFLSTANTSGYCTEHWYDSKRKKGADGEKHAGGGRSKVNNSKVKPLKPRAAQVALNRLKRAEDPPEVNGNGSGVATICVSEGALDRWWATASLEEKASAFSNHLSAAEAEA